MSNSSYCYGIVRLLGNKSDWEEISAYCRTTDTINADAETEAAGYIIKQTIQLSNKTI